LEEIKNTVIATANETIVYLKDIATVEMDYEDPQWIGRYNGENAIFISLKIKQGKNILNTVEDIQVIEEKFKASLPPNMELHTAFEQAPAVEWNRSSREHQQLCGRRRRLEIRSSKRNRRGRLCHY